MAVGLVVLLAVLQKRGGSSADRLVMYCAAGARVPVELIAKQYEDEYAVAVELQYGGSGELLNQIEINTI